jgi:hypothetical protein
MEEAGTKLDVDAVCGMREDVGAQSAEDSFKHRNRHKADNQNFERADALVHEHLVDHHLKEER